MRSSAMMTIPRSRKRVSAQQRLIFGVVMFVSMAGVGAAFAQSVASGTIEGTVRDQSSSVLPGVTITASSPQLQVGQLVQVSDSAGNYKFLHLPPRTDRLKT